MSETKNNFLDELEKLTILDEAIEILIKETNEKYSSTLNNFLEEAASINFLQKKQTDKSELLSVEVNNYSEVKEKPSIKIKYSMSTESGLINISLEPWIPSKLVKIEKNGKEILNTHSYNSLTDRFYRRRSVFEFGEKLGKIYEEKFNAVIDTYLLNMFKNPNKLAFSHEKSNTKGDQISFKLNAKEENEIKYEIKHDEGQNSFDIEITKKDAPQTKIGLYTSISEFNILEPIYLMTRSQGYKKTSDFSW